MVPSWDRDTLITRSCTSITVYQQLTVWSTAYLPDLLGITKSDNTLADGHNVVSAILVDGWDDVL